MYSGCKKKLIRNEKEKSPKALVCTFEDSGSENDFFGLLISENDKIYGCVDLLILDRVFWK